MNAPQERGQENYMRVQSLIFQLLLKKEGSEDHLTKVLMLQSSFRDWAEHLDDKDLIEDWKKAEIIANRLEGLQTTAEQLTDDERHELGRLEQAYQDFHTRLMAFVKTVLEDLDPEALNELTDAVEVYDVDRARAIIDKCLEMRRRSVERIEE